MKKDLSISEGHPAHTFIIENEAVEKFISEELVQLAGEYEQTGDQNLRKALKK
jgi:hypothetical protein